MTAPPPRPAGRLPSRQPDDPAPARLARGRMRFVWYFVANVLIALALVYLVLPRDVRLPWERGILVALVFTGTLPMLASVIQYFAVGLHRFFIRYDTLRPCYPRVAVVVPAWNEGLVIGSTIDQLISLIYPPERLRVYVVDDASTDETPTVVRAKAEQFPGRVHLLRREFGGQGKAHTLNHGIQHLLQDDWAEAVLIIDADVLFETSALRRMTRHFTDPNVGAVTAYIKEGSNPGNYLTRFVGYEYVTAQAVSRRAQNIFGALACLAGGAQLHTRANLERLGGRIDTSSLAEDTVMTLKTQLAGNKVVFEGNAIVWAEEPPDLVGLWKQRLRWARGNVQVSLQFASVWGHGRLFPRIGGALFGFLWFTILLMPVLMLGTTVGLLGLYFQDAASAWRLFQMYWIWNAILYVFTVLMTLAVDLDTAKRSWLQAIVFPGVISLLIIIYSVHPVYFDAQFAAIAGRYGYAWPTGATAPLTLFLYIWPTLCMFVAYAAKLVSHRERLRGVGAVLLWLGGYGPFLCAVTAASYVKEILNTPKQWDKTVKTGQVAMPR